ncbi:MAG: hypothetical protein H0V91_06730 [Flavisolibacter sp.]|nr:hypothetical protein [Flavisolibacter sp.]
MKNLFLLALPVLLIACSKKNEDIPQLTEETLATNWRLDAVKQGSETWMQINYEKNSTSFDLYCVYDAQRNQSFISKSSCSYNNGYTTVTVASGGCATSVYKRDTTWEQITNFDFAFSPSKEFILLRAMKYSKRLILENETCTSGASLPEYNLAQNAFGTWSFDAAAGMITATYESEGGGIDNEVINQFKVISYTGQSLIIKHQSNNGIEYKLQKL